MEDKRSHKRFTVEGMEISGKMLFANEVNVLDISTSGISLKADRRLEIGREYSLKLGYADKILALNGVVMWSILNELRKISADEIAPLYQAGLKFTDISTDKLNELIDFITFHKQSDYELEVLNTANGQRLGTRVHIDPTPKPILQFPLTYTLKKLSLSGMLVESEHELALESRLPMEISLPGNESISCTGRVAYCVKADTEDVVLYSIGIEFMDMPDEDKDRLEKFIKALDERDEGPSSFVKIYGS